MRPIRTTLTAAGVSPPISLDPWADAPAAVMVEVSGGAGFTVQYSFDDPNDLVNPIAQGSMVWDSTLCPAGAVAGVANISFALPVSPLWIRVQQTGTGTVTMVVLQYNVVNA
jgi:hypothetical protein